MWWWLLFGVVISLEFGIRLVIVLVVCSGIVLCFLKVNRVGMVIFGNWLWKC